jgi:hypothetical protein
MNLDIATFNGSVVTFKGKETGATFDNCVVTFNDKIV